jgi:hypothetical protein
MTEKATYVGRCRAAGRKHGLRRDQSCGEPVLPTHGLFCRKHYDRIKRQVRAGKATWEDFERGFRRVSRAKSPGGRIRASRRPYIHELKPKSSSAEPVSRSAERGQSPKVRKKLRALKQRLDPNGVPGTYSEGKLESTVPHTLRFPEIHSCLWLHQDGVVLRGAPRAKAEHVRKSHGTYGATLLGALTATGSENREAITTTHPGYEALPYVLPVGSAYALHRMR